MNKTLIAVILSAGLLLAADPFEAQGPPGAAPNNGGTHPSSRDSAAITCAACSFDALRFLEGTWDAKTPAGPAGPAVSGTYSFKKELNGHILARHSSSDACKGPADFDCDHHDLLYIYQDAPGQPLKAIYFDNEGHAIHYDVSVPTPTQAVFLSDATVPGPRFRLVYELRNAVMSGKFQMQLPGQSDWKSYLEWTGAQVR